MVLYKIIAIVIMQSCDKIYIKLYYIIYKNYLIII